MAPQWMSLLAEVISPTRAERRRQHIPPLDGALLPNERLHECDVVSGPAIRAPLDALPLGSDGLAVAAGRHIMVCKGPDFADQHACVDAAGTVGPLAQAADGSLHFCVAGVGVMRRRASGEVDEVVTAVDGIRLGCPTAVVVAADGTVYVAEGSRTRTSDEWVWDLMERNASGRLLAVTPDGAVSVLQSGLAYPNGLVLSHDEDSLLFTSAWDHSVRRLWLAGEQAGRVDVVRANLAGYPAGISRSERGTYWLSFFALRTHLVEFVLREHAYRTKMMRTVDPDYWVRPALRRVTSGLEPLQGGSIKKLGETKPWAPPRSYGLVVEMDDGGATLRSMHSRANGDRHGTWTAREHHGRLFIACAGADAVLVASKELRSR